MSELKEQPKTEEELKEELSIKEQAIFDACEGAEERFPDKAEAAREELKLGNKLNVKQAKRLYDAIHAITFHWVRFHAKSNPEDQDDVHLIVNGEVLVMQREKKVVVPSHFLEAADHGTYIKFRQLPNKPRKVMGRIKTFPYDKLGDATEKEFREQKRAGTKKTKDHIKRFGFDADPDEDGDV